MGSRLFEREDEASLLFYFSMDDTPACLAIDHSFEEYFGVWLDGSRFSLGTPADDCEGILVGHDTVAGIDGTVDHRLLKLLRGQFAASDDHIAVASYLFEGNGTGRFLAGGTYPVFGHVVPVEFPGWLSGRGTGCCLAFYHIDDDTTIGHEIVVHVDVNPFGVSWYAVAQRGGCLLLEFFLVQRPARLVRRATRHVELSTVSRYRLGRNPDGGS